MPKIEHNLEVNELKKKKTIMKNIPRGNKKAFLKISKERNLFLS